MDHLQPSRVDPRKQALLEARFFARDKVILDTFYMSILTCITIIFGNLAYDDEQLL
jgi:hypothetical protein